MNPNSLTSERQPHPSNIGEFLQRIKKSFYQTEEITINIGHGIGRDTIELQEVAEISKYDVSREAAKVAILEIANLSPRDVELLIDEVLNNFKEITLIIKKH